jgi:hypothetical protein
LCRGPCRQRCDLKVLAVRDAGVCEQGALILLFAERGGNIKFWQWCEFVTLRIVVEQLEALM